MLGFLIQGCSLHRDFGVGFLKGVSGGMKALRMGTCNSAAADELRPDSEEEGAAESEEDDDNVFGVQSKSVGAATSGLSAGYNFFE